MGEIIAREFFDAVFNHITDDQHDKKRQGEIAEFLLEKETHHGGKHHCQPGSNAQVELLHQFAIFSLRHIEVEIAVDIFFEHATSKHHVPVALVVGSLQVEVAHRGAVMIFGLNFFTEQFDGGGIERLLLLMLEQEIEQFGGIEFHHIAHKFVAIAVIVSGFSVDGGLVHDGAQIAVGFEHGLISEHKLHAQHGHIV